MSTTPPLNNPGLWWPTPEIIILYLTIAYSLSKKLNLPFYMSWLLDIALHASLPFVCVGIMGLLCFLCCSLWYMVRVGFMFNLLTGPIWCLVNLVCFMTVDPMLFQGTIDVMHEFVSGLPEWKENHVHYYRQALRRFNRGEYPR